MFLGWGPEPEQTRQDRGWELFAEQRLSVRLVLFYSCSACLWHFPFQIGGPLFPHVLFYANFPSSLSHPNPGSSVMLSWHSHFPPGRQRAGKAEVGTKDASQTADSERNHSSFSWLSPVATWLSWAVLHTHPSQAQGTCPLSFLVVSTCSSLLSPLCSGSSESKQTRKWKKM